MLHIIRERLTLLLLVLLPFHALLVTVGTRLLVGPGHAPLTYLALWKEGVLGIVMVLVLIEMWGKVAGRKQKAEVRSVDSLDIFIVLLITLGVIVSASHSSLLTSAFLYGFKYDFLPLVAFLFLRRVPWSERFRRLAFITLIAVGGVVGLYGLVTIFLPDAYFRFLGYSDLHSLYLPEGPIAAFQQLGGMALRRVQSTMSGPNQLGLWLLIPLSLVFVHLGRRVTEGAESWLLRWSLFSRSRYDVLCSVFLLVMLIACALTFSRAAWIGAACTVLAVFTHRALPQASRRVVVRVLTGFGVLIVLLALLRPEILLRTASSRDHLVRPLAAVQTIFGHPLGLGLGTAGPASNHVSDACVFLPEGGDASWAAAHPALCVFLGNTQVQPDVPCKCPLLPENWYLQIGVELGIAGFVLFIVFVLLVLLRLRRNTSPLAIGTFAAFVGVSIAALFLHAWESSAVAYTLWVLAAVILCADAVERKI